MRQVAVPAHCSRGFTLLELLVTLALGGILLSLAVIGLRDFIANNRAATQTNEIVGALQLARNEAVIRSAPVTLCAASNPAGTACASGTGSINWSNGWIVFVDSAGAAGVIDAGDTVLRIYPVLKANSTLTADTPFIRYKEDGFLSAGVTTLALRVPQCKLTNNRDIQITAQGRPRLSYVAC